MVGDINPGEAVVGDINPGAPAKSHYLAVANSRVSERVGSQHPPKCSDPKLVLESGVLRHGAVEVSLNLLSGQAVFPHGLLYELSIVARMGHHLVPGPWGDTGGSFLSLLSLSTWATVRLTGDTNAPWTRGSFSISYKV